MVKVGSVWKEKDGIIVEVVDILNHDNLLIKVMNCGYPYLKMIISEDELHEQFSPLTLVECELL